MPHDGLPNTSPRLVLKASHFRPWHEIAPPIEVLEGTCLGLPLLHYQEPGLQPQAYGPHDELLHLRQREGVIRSTLWKVRVNAA